MEVFTEKELLYISRLLHEKVDPLNNYLSVPRNRLRIYIQIENLAKEYNPILNKINYLLNTKQFKKET